MKADFPLVAIDGGAASGKTSTARGLATRLHFLHVDTGSHYRALTRACTQAGLAPVAGPSLAAFLTQIRLGTAIEGHSAWITLDGERPADADLRTPEVNALVSLYAALPLVRERVKSYQREQVQVAQAAGFRGLVMDGRDIGTVILPQAQLKIFLQADEATRAARRVQEGRPEAIAERDRRDSSRTTAPLQAAADAVLLDNSALSLEQVIDTVERLLRARVSL